MTQQREKPLQVSRRDWDAVDVPEMTDEEFADARPFSTVFPDAYRAWKSKGGRPKSAEPKVKIGFRLAADVVDAVRASGKNYNARVEAILRAAIDDGRL